MTGKSCGAKAEICLIDAVARINDAKSLVRDKASSRRLGLAATFVEQILESIQGGEQFEENAVESFAAAA